MTIPLQVEEVYAAMPDPIRERALDLRRLILETADEAGIAALEETLKWGEPAYLPGRSGTTIRIAHDARSGACKMLVHCQTRLVDAWRDQFAGLLRFEGNRAILIDPDTALPEGPLRCCILAALTYHDRKSPRRARVCGAGDG